MIDSVPELGAIVVGSYSDQFGGSDRQDRIYTLLTLDAKDRPVDKRAWYDEEQLTLVSADRDAGEAILQSYKRRQP